MNTLVFDIETIPDVALGRRLHNLGDLPDEPATRALHKRLSCPVIDVTGLAIEETAARVAELVDDRRRASLEGARGSTV